MSLAKSLLNNPGLIALCVPDELMEIRVLNKKPWTGATVKLRRTYNQTWPDGSVTKFWRVVGPQGHPNYESDLSIQGLQEWGIVPQGRML